MKIDRIVINDIETINIVAFSYVRETNKHSEAKITGLISEAKSEEYIRDSLTKEWGSICGIDENGKRICIFGGYVKNMSVFQLNGHKAIELTLISGTYLMDLKRNTLTFQDVNELYSDIVKNMIIGYYNTSYNISAKANKAIQNMVVQYEETEWEFILRLASQLNIRVIPYSSYEGVGFDFGVNEGKSGVDVTDVIQATEKHDKDGTSYILKTRDYLDIGSKVNYHDGSYYVYKSDGEHAGQELVNTYELRRCEDFKQIKYQNDRIIGASLESVVTDIQSDQVKIKVMGEDGRKTRWFPYSTIYSSPDGTGWYCMPEIGDRIRLYFPSNKEKDAYTISSVHLPVSKDNEQSSGDIPRSNPDNKSIKNKDGKEILFTPDRIVITNNKGMSIEINDNEGISIISDKNISIESEDKVDLVSINQGLNIVANEEINLIQNNSSINIKDDVTVTGGRIKTV